MDCEHQACAECTRKCLLLHGKGKSSTTSVSSFFKVMIGDRFSKALFLPPKFARMVSGVIEKETFLEDCSGLRWKVKLSNLEGSIAFQEGWNSFASDHGLDVGYFLVFYCITGSHFVVQVYDTTGCEKLDFFKIRNREKGAKINRSFTANEGQCCKGNEDSRNKSVHDNSDLGRSDAEADRGQRQGNNLDKATKVAEKLSRNEIAIGRTQGGSKKLDNNTTQDYGDKSAGSWKKMADNTGADRSKKFGDKNGLRPCQNYSSLVSQKEVGLGNVEPLGPGASKNKMMEDDSEKKDKLIGVSCKDSCKKNNGCQLTRSKLQQEKNSMEGSHLSYKVLKRCHIAAVTDKAKSRTKLKAIKSEQIQSPCSLVGGHNKHGKAIKPETLDEESLPSPTAGSISCLIAANSQSFLELPARLPSFLWKGSKTILITERTVVLLRGPEKRLWPVLYREILAFKILTTGWKAFSKASNIKPGDECILRLENETEGIFQVQVVRKQQG